MQFSFCTTSVCKSAATNDKIEATEVKVLTGQEPHTMIRFDVKTAH